MLVASAKHHRITQLLNSLQSVFLPLTHISSHHPANPSPASNQPTQSPPITTTSTSTFYQTTNQTTDNSNGPSRRDRFPRPQPQLHWQWLRSQLPQLEVLRAPQVLPRCRRWNQHLQLPPHWTEDHCSFHLRLQPLHRSSIALLVHDLPLRQQGRRSCRLRTWGRRDPLPHRQGVHREHQDRHYRLCWIPAQGRC